MLLLSLFKRLFKLVCPTDGYIAVEASYFEPEACAEKSQPKSVTKTPKMLTPIDERNAWIRNTEYASRETQESFEMVISALGTNYPTLESLLIVPYPRPREPLVSVVCENPSIEERRLMGVLRQGGLDSERIAWKLIWKLRDSRFEIKESWWQLKGYHCYFDYGERIYGEPYVDIRGCYCRNPDAYKEFAMRYASVEEYKASKKQCKTYLSADSELFYTQFLGGSPWNPPYAGVFTKESRK